MLTHRCSTSDLSGKIYNQIPQKIRKNFSLNYLNSSSVKAGSHQPNFTRCFSMEGLCGTLVVGVACLNHNSVGISTFYRTKTPCKEIIVVSVEQRSEIRLQTIRIGSSSNMAKFSRILNLQTKSYHFSTLKIFLVEFCIRYFRFGSCSRCEKQHRDS